MAKRLRRRRRISRFNPKGISRKERRPSDRALAAYITKKQLQLIALLGISTVREMAMFKAAEASYFLDSATRSKPDLDFVAMSNDWNAGRPKLSNLSKLNATQCRPDGRDVFSKTPASLQTYWTEIRSGARKRQRAYDAIAQSVTFNDLQEKLKATLATSSIFPEIDIRNILGETAYDSSGEQSGWESDGSKGAEPGHGPLCE